MPKPLIIAHRGDSSRALENSLHAIDLALSVPVDMIELDVRKTRDNKLYIMHDKTTGRTCDRDLEIENSTTEEIKQVALKNNEAVPTLDDVLGSVAGRAGLNLEIKSAGAGALTAAHITGRGYQGRVLLSSFKEQEVLDARRILPAAPCSVIYDDFTVREVAGYAGKGYRFISLRKKIVTPDVVAACHERSIKVYVWTVDEPAEIKRLWEWGVDGIYSNRPALLKEVLEGAA